MNRKADNAQINPTRRQVMKQSSIKMAVQFTHKEI